MSNQHTSAEEIRAKVFEAMNLATEINAQDVAEYINLMHAISAECAQRAEDAYVDYQQKRKSIPICTSCGSTKVRADAWAEWNVESGQWVLNNSFDDMYCESCEGECSVDFVKVKRCHCNGMQVLCNDCDGTGYVPAVDKQVQP